MYIFDIEADSLDATKIHCVSYVEVGKKIKTLTTYKEMRKFFLSADVLIGHNIMRYDGPTIERILGIKTKAKMVDTLALSWYIYINRPKHGLETFGVDYDRPKLQIDDWENLPLEDYIARCERDVDINTCLWKDQYKFLTRLYESEEEAWRLIDYLSHKMHCATLQEASRWKLNKKKCKKGSKELTLIKESKTLDLIKVMPKVPKYTKRNKPKKPFKQDGTMSEAGKRWFKLVKDQNLPDDATDTKEITSYEEPKPSSPAQLKELLFSLGWQPDEFKYINKKREDGGGVRKIPQINTQVPGKWGLSESVKRVVERNPEVEPIDGLSVVTHRLGILNTFLEVEKDGYVMAEIQGLTNTLRFKHAVCLNLPGVASPYGELVRGCLIAPKGYELCGSDKSSLEDKVKQHYLYDYDPEYVKEMQTPGYDPHTALAVANKAITAEQEQGYKDELPKLKALVGAIRRVYKTTNYACQYGASGFKIGLSAGISKAKGDLLHAAYWKKNWAINEVADACITKVCGGSKWLYNPVSKLWYSLRHDKDRFSTLCQGTGVFCFDTWVKHVLAMREQLTAQFHDEIVLTIRKGFRKQCKKLLKKAVKRTNKELNLNVKLSVDVQFGSSYAEIH